jgi:hypothetical protein
MNSQVKKRHIRYIYIYISLKILLVSLLITVNLRTQALGLYSFLSIFHGLIHGGWGGLTCIMYIRTTFGVSNNVYCILYREQK